MLVPMSTPKSYDKVHQSTAMYVKYVVTSHRHLGLFRSRLSAKGSRVRLSSSSVVPRRFIGPATLRYTYITFCTQVRSTRDLPI